jgi:hypothetical protein
MKEQIINQLKALFQKYDDRYMVHSEAAPILENASRDQTFLYDVIRLNLSDPAFLQKKRHYPTLSMPVVESPEFSLVVNIFPSLPSKDTDISFQSIHHHGSLLLTTVGAFGPGYGSIVFKKNYSIDPATGITKMEIEKEYQNILSKAEFIDARQPHIVFYPTDFSATYAFWCNKKITAKESLKKFPLINKLKKPAAKIISKMGLGNLIGINKVEYFDFYIDSNNVIALKERLAYEKEGDNENFLQNIFSFIQQTGFKDEKFLRELMMKENTPEAALKWIEKLLTGENISPVFYDGHLNIPKVNLSKKELSKAIGNA